MKWKPVDEVTAARLRKAVREGRVEIASQHHVDYLLTWNFRHIDNAKKKPAIRSICAADGYTCPEICTPMELLQEDEDNVPG